MFAFKGCLPQLWIPFGRTTMTQYPSVDEIQDVAGRLGVTNTNVELERSTQSGRFEGNSSLKIDFYNARPLGKDGEKITISFRFYNYGGAKEEVLISNCEQFGRLGSIEILVFRDQSNGDIPQNYVEFRLRTDEVENAVVAVPFQVNYKLPSKRCTVNAYM